MRNSPRLLAGVAAALLVLMVVVLRVATSGPEQSERVGDAATRDGWQTIEYRGVRVDVPDEWERKDSEGCPYAVERWGPVDASRCGEEGGVGVSLLDSSTFDARFEPGDIRLFTEESVPQWSGYVMVERLAVSADGPEDVVRAILDSARPASVR